MWYVKHFEELSTRELYEIYRLRSQVFVVEQACAYPDIDETDLTAIHLFYRTDRIIAYARLYPEAESVKIGRIVVPSELRGTGLGKELVSRSIALAQRYDKPILISAQEYLDGFYGRMGFIRTSEVYLEDDIPHQDMVYHGPVLGIHETKNLREVTMEDKRKNTVDPVDHENKKIKDAEDYIEHDQVDKDTPERKTDVMKDNRKQVSAEIVRTELGEELKDKGC